MRFVIRGVYPIAAVEPCHLIEVELPDSEDIDWSEVTQETAGLPPADWQVPWDERPLDDDRHRWIFFFHYLDLTRPLLTRCGPVELPPPTSLPPYLSDIEYAPP